MQSITQWFFANVSPVLERSSQSLDLVIDVGVKGTVLILLAIVAAFLLRHASAAVRHRLWGLMFFGLLLLPLVSYSLPAWRVPLLPQIAAKPNEETQRLTRLIESPIETVDEQIADPDPAESFVLAPSAPSSGPALAPLTSSTDLSDSPSGKTAVAAGSAPLAGPSRSAIALFIWSIGVALVLMPLLVGILNNALHWLRSSRLDDTDWHGLMAETQNQLHLQRRVDLLFSDRPLVPVTWGLFRPIVLLPRQANSWTTQLRRFVLLHELSHVKRWDVGFQMLARVACALYWFHPLVWYALRQIRIERELACDDLVLSTGEPAADYAEQLVAIARTFRPTRMVAAVAMAHPNSLEHRVTAILDRTRPRLPLSPRTAAILFVLAIGFATGIAVVEPSALGVDSHANGSEVSVFTIDESPRLQDVARQDTDDIFTDIEPGVRILGKIGSTSLLGEVLDFAPLPDGNRIVAVCKDGLKIWDLDKNSIVQSLAFEQSITACRALQFSKDKQTLAISTLSDGAVGEVQAGAVMLVGLDLKLQAEFIFDDQPDDPDATRWNDFSALAFSPDDSKLAMATGYTVLVFDIDSEDLLQSVDLETDSASPAHLLFERNRILVFGSQPRLIDLQRETVAKLPDFHGALDGCFQCCFDKPSKRLFGLFVRGPDRLRTIRLSDGNSEPIEFGQEGFRPFKLTLSPDGSLLAICHFHSTPDGASMAMDISVLNTTDFDLEFNFSNLPLRPGVVKFTAANDGLLVAFNMDAGFQHLPFDPQQVEQKPNYQLNRPLRSVLLSKDGSHLVGRFKTMQTSSWDWTTGEETQADGCNVFFPAELADNYFAQSQQGTTLALVKHTFGKDKPRKIQEYAMKKLIAGPLTEYLFGLSKTPKIDQVYWVVPTAVAVNGSKTELHVGVLDTRSGIRIQSFDIPSYKRTRDVLFKRRSKEMMTKKIAIANDGKRFAEVDSGKLRVIDVESRETIFEQPANKSIPLFFSKTQDWLAISNSRGVTIIDAESGETLKRINAPKPQVAYAIGSGELLVASAKSGSPVRIFDTETWDITLEHATKTSNRISATISSDGRRVAFALDNCRLELWDVGKLENQ